MTMTEKLKKAYNYVSKAIQQNPKVNVYDTIEEATEKIAETESEWDAIYEALFIYWLT